MLLLPYTTPYVAPTIPAYDATGAGFTPSAPVTTAPWSHTAAAGAEVLAFFNTNGVTLASAPTYGSFTMSLKTSVTDGLGNIQFLYVLANAPGGAQTLTVTPSSSAVILGQSVSYTGVNAVATPVTLVANSASLSQSPTCSANQIIVQSFSQQSEDSITSFSGGNSRSKINLSGVSTQGGLTVSDATTSTTFIASASIADTYTAISVVLS